MRKGATRGKSTRVKPGGDARTKAPRVRSRAVTVAVVVVLAFVAAAIALILGRHEASTRRDWQERLVATAEERKAAIVEYLDARRKDAEVFAAFPTIRQAAAAPSAADRAEVAGHAREILETGRRRWGSGTVALFGADLSEQVRAGEPVAPEVLASLRETFARGRGTDLVRTPGGDRIFFAEPVAGAPAAAPAAWIVIVDDAAIYLWGVLRREPVASRTGEVLLARQEGDRLVFLTPLRHARADAAQVVLPLEGASVAARDAVLGRERVGTYTDYRGTPVLAAVRRLPETGWGLVVKVDLAEALGGILWDRLWAGVTFLAIALALLGLVRSVRGRERLAASEERRRGDERHRSVLAQVRDAIIWVRPADGRILEANRAAEDLWGYPREALLEKTVFDLRPGEESGAARPRVEEAGNGGMLFRTRNLRSDGRLFPVEVSSRPVVLDGEELLVSVVRDVSEAEAALARIRLLNRLLRTIAAVEQALVGVRDRKAALSRTCEEIVATGEFAVAWFGVPGEAGRLVPAAFAGKTEGFFDEVELTLRAGPAGPSAAASAFLEERTVVVQDWGKDPIVAPVREAGLRRGYRSSAACPVRIGGSVWGVLALYAFEPEAFVPEAVLLLEELARDVGLALELVDSEERRRRAEESLAASEERYRTLFEDNPAPMWVFDVETLRFLAVNEAATALYGFTQEEFLGLSLRDIRPAEDVSRLEADVLVPREGIRRSGPWRHRRKDGSELRVEVVTHDVDFAGRRARLVLAHDVTDRLRAEEKIRAFFDSGMTGAIFGDVHGNVLAANDEFLRIVGSSREDLEAGKLRWIDITPPEWLPLDAERVAEAQARGVCTPYEKEYVRGDGTRVPVLVGYALVGEKREESVAFILDLTSRKAAEARLGETTQLLQTVVEGSPAPILTLDREGRVTSWNPAAEAVFGWSAEEAVSRPLPIVPHGAEAEFRSFLSDILAGHSFAGREVRRVRKDGTAVDVSIAAAPLRDAAGAVSGVAAVLVDVSARVRAEEEVRRLNAGLEESVEQRTAELVAKSKELESFAYSISHDLRAPLRAIGSFSRIVEEDYSARLDDEGRRLLGVVGDNARRMGQLIDDLLAFSRAGRHEVRRSRVDVGALVAEVLGEIVPEDEKSRSELKVGELPPVAADPALLRQVFVNLLANAVKFSASRPRRVVEVTGRREAGKVVYDVSDNGVGFDMRYAGKLFGVFQRLHGREFEGTGVGLALAERIVARHGGTIAARGEVDRGATFTVSFPDGGEAG